MYFNKYYNNKQIDQQIRDAEKEYENEVNEINRNPLPIKTIDDWLNTYGRPEKQIGEGMLSSFKDNDRAFAPTKYHRGFKSTAKIMIKGRLTQ